MFERFTARARQVVVLAQEEARRRRDGVIGSEHLLLAVFAVPDNLGLTVLGAFSVTKADVEADLEQRSGGLGPSDADALATLGIDLDAVRRQVEDVFGPGALDRTRAATGRGRRWSGGHIPFDRDAKKVLELALREAIRLGHNYIGVEHLVLGMLHTATGAAGEILRGRGTRLDAARVIVEELVRGRQAG